MSPRDTRAPRERPPREGPRPRPRSRPPDRTQVRRRRRALLGVCALVVLAAVAAILSLGPTGRHPDPRTRARSTTTTVTRSSTTVSASTHARPPRPRRPTPPLPVARTVLHLAEPDSGEGPRPLTTVVRYPVARPGGTRAAGRFPLVVFSQGYDVSAEAYAALLRAWSAAGFVVADPTYPRTDPDAPGGVDESDILNHPGDLRFVIHALLADARSGAAPLRDAIDPTRVAVVGQSDGGDVSLAVAAGSCCRDPAVGAAVILSGAELASFGGSYFTGPAVPLLVVQGSADTINVPACSAQIYDAAPRPKYYLDVLGAEHLTPYLESGPARRGVIRTVTAFLDAFLARRPAPLHRLLARAGPGRGARLSAGHVAPVPPGSCPGAP